MSKIAPATGERSVKRWTELHRVTASAVACTEAQRDNLQMSEIKGEKPKALFHMWLAAPSMMDAFLCAPVCVCVCVGVGGWLSLKRKLLGTCIRSCFKITSCDSGQNRLLFSRKQ